MSGKAKAEALRLAHKRLEASGWKYSAKNIGQTAREILDGLEGRP